MNRSILSLTKTNSSIAFIITATSINLRKTLTFGVSRGCSLQINFDEHAHNFFINMHLTGSNGNATKLVHYQHIQRRRRTAEPLLEYLHEIDSVGVYVCNINLVEGTGTLP